MSVNNVVCGVKHTTYQPTDDEWKCPHCGADNANFWIEEAAEGTTEGCTLLHDEDLASCSKCGHHVSGKALSAKIQKQKDLVTCSHCKGTGLVKKE